MIANTPLMVKMAAIQTLLGSAEIVGDNCVFCGAARNDLHHDDCEFCEKAFFDGLLALKLIEVHFAEMVMHFTNKDTFSRIEFEKMINKYVVKHIMGLNSAVRIENVEGALSDCKLIALRRLCKEFSYIFG